MTFTLVRVGAYAVLAGLGSWVAYEDWRWRRIRNKRVLGLFLCCAAGYAALYLGQVKLPEHFFKSAAIHGALSVAVGLVFWLSQVWPPGDAKLFMAASCFLPLGNPALPNYPYALFLVLLINIFVPCTVCLAFWMLWVYGRRLATAGFYPTWRRLGDRMSSGRRRLGELRWGDAGMLVSFFALFLPATALRYALVGAAQTWRHPLCAALCLLLFLHWEDAVELARRRAGYFLFYLSVFYLGAGLIFFPAFVSRHMQYTLKMFTMAGLAFWVLRLLLTRGVQTLEERSILAAEAQAGMVPLDMKLDSSAEWHAAFGAVSPTGLTAEQAALLRSRAAGRPEAAEIIIIRKSNAFAAWIVAGTALTWILMGDVIRLLMITLS